MSTRLIWLAALVVGLSSSVAHAREWPEVNGELPPLNLGANDAAVLIGIGDYFLLPDITNADRNAVDWNRYLQKVRGIPNVNVRMLLNADATKENIIEATQNAAKQVKPGGTLWFIYVGHGASAPDHTDGMLLGSDTQQTELSLVSRGVAQKDLLAIIDGGAQTNAVIMFDACFSGTTADGKPLVPNSQASVIIKRVEPPAGRAAILSASDLVAGPLPQHNRPAFTYLMLGSMRGWADADKDQTVTITEAFDYTKNVLEDKVRDRVQVPSLNGNKTIVLAKGATEEGPNLIDIIANPGKSGGLFSTVSAPVLDVSKFAGGAFGDISIPVEQARDDALEAADSTVASAASRRDAWCRFAGIDDKNPYKDEAAKQCASWTSYVAADAKLEQSMGMDYNVLIDYLGLKRRTDDEKRRAVAQFVDIYGRYDDRQEVRAAKLAAANMDNGAPPGISKDDDGDGILFDSCPNEAEDMDGDNDTDGCPEKNVIENLDDAGFHLHAFTFNYFRLDLGVGFGVGLWDQKGVPSRFGDISYKPFVGASTRLTFAFAEAAVRYDVDLSRDFADGGGHLTGELGARIFGIGPWTPSLGLDYRNVGNFATGRPGGLGVYFANTFLFTPEFSMRLSYRQGLGDVRSVLPIHTVMLETSITFIDPSGSAFFDLLGEMCE